MFILTIITTPFTHTLAASLKSEKFIYNSLSLQKNAISWNTILHTQNLLLLHWQLTIRGCVGLPSQWIPLRAFFP